MITREDCRRYKLSEIARMEGVHRGTVLRWCVKGVRPAGDRTRLVKLRRTRRGGQWRVSRADLDTFMVEVNGSQAHQSAPPLTRRDPAASRGHQAAMERLRAKGLA